MHHPKNNFMSKWHLIQPLQREIYKKPTLIYYILVRSKKSLVMYHTLQSLCVCVWLVNTLISTAPIGSPIICMWSPADICGQWERNLSFVLADDRNVWRTSYIRTSTWEARTDVIKWVNTKKDLPKGGFWARETEQPKQTLVFTKTAGHKTTPGSITLLQNRVPANVCSRTSCDSEDSCHMINSHSCFINSTTFRPCSLYRALCLSKP